MGLFVNTNASSLNAQRQLMNSGNALDTAFKRLSSGFRINSAADDAAGLQISNRLTSQVNGLDQASRNANDGISMAQTAEGAMDEITNSLQRMRTLAIQAQNGALSDVDRQALNKEVTALKTEITRVAETTEFGGKKLLNGSLTGNKFLVGANAGQTIDVNISIGLRAAGSVASVGLGMSALGVSTFAAASAALGKIDSVIAKIDSKRADLGAVQNRFQATIRNLANISENVSSARARIRDTDFAKETAELTRSQILQQTSQTVLAQANQRPQAALSLLG